MNVTSFPPVATLRARVLILGSMPGVRSLQAQQYYGHPHNAFWYIMGQLCGADPELPYKQRLQRLNAAGIAIWDVLKHCHRPGSMDSDIASDTEVPNDIAPFLEKYRHINRIGFNGQKAAQAFKRHIQPTLSQQIIERVEMITLPSTSPANARLTKQEKLQCWSAFIKMG